MSELPKDQAMIVKIINVVGRTKHGNDIIGFIIYERSISDSYRMMEVSESNDKRELLPETEEQFPFDELDNIIMNAIKIKFPDSFFRSLLITSVFGNSKFEHLLKSPKKTAILIVDPDFSGVDDRSLLSESFADFKEEICIYQNDSVEYITGHSFRTQCDYKIHEAITQRLSRIKFL